MQGNSCLTLPPGSLRYAVAEPIGRQHAERQRDQPDKCELRTHDPSDHAEPNQAGERQRDRRELHYDGAHSLQILVRGHHQVALTTALKEPHR